MMMNRGTQLGVWAAVLVGVVAGCQCDDNRLGSVAPNMEVTPNPVVFGQVAVGSATERIVEVRNRGQSALSVYSVTVVEGEAEISVARLFTTDCEGNSRTGDQMTISGGTCARFAVRMLPQATTSLAGVVRIESNDPQAPEFDLPVTGDGVIAALRACVLTEEGEIDEAACTNLASAATEVPTISFTDTPMGDKTERTVRLFNLGEGSLTLTNARAEGHGDHFHVEGDAFTGDVPHGEPKDLKVFFAPKESGVKEGMLVLPSNDLSHPLVKLPLVGKALGAELCFDPPTGLDFGTVPRGESVTQTLKIENCGFVSYSFQQIDFTEDDPLQEKFAVRWVTIDGAAGATPAAGHAFKPGDQLFAEVTYKPVNNAGVDKAGFGIRTEYQRGRIPVRGEAAFPGCGVGEPKPTANVRVTRGGTTVTPPGPFEPLTTLQFDASGSNVPAGGATYAWRVVRQPQGGTQNLTGATASRKNLYLELTGEYEIELIVRDENNCGSEPVRITVTSLSDADLVFQLTWPEAFGDVDAHLVKGTGGIFSGGADCYWSNCMKNGPYGPYSMAWGSGNSNPTLDVDARWGKGPEQIRIVKPADGTYVFHTHYYCSRMQVGNRYGETSFGPTNPRLRVFVNGVMKVDETVKMNDLYAWEAATVVVSNNGQDIAVTPGTRVYKTSQGCL